MNFLQRLRLRLLGWPAEKDIGPERVQPREPEEYHTDVGVPPVTFDQIERPDGSGPSLDTLLEMNRVQGW